jgi:hypothetical protein
VRGTLRESYSLRIRGTSPSSRPSPRKRGEGEERRADVRSSHAIKSGAAKAARVAFGFDLSMTSIATTSTHLNVLAARMCPSYDFRFALATEEGAGKAGCPPHPWSACNKKHAAEPQVQADHPAFPAQWLYGLYVIFPVTMLGCHRHPAGHDLARLSACIGAPEPHDFAVRTHAARRAKIAPGDVRPSHPAPNVRDDREPPLFLGCGMGESIVLICPTTQCRGRATDWHDGQCRILGQMRLLIVGAPRAFCAQAILVELMGVVCPTLPSDLSRRPSPRQPKWPTPPERHVRSERCQNQTRAAQQRHEVWIIRIIPP